MLSGPDVAARMQLKVQKLTRENAELRKDIARLQTEKLSLDAYVQTLLKRLETSEERAAKRVSKQSAKPDVVMQDVVS